MNNNDIAYNNRNIYDYIFGEINSKADLIMYVQCLSIVILLKQMKYVKIVQLSE